MYPNLMQGQRVEHASMHLTPHVPGVSRVSCAGVDDTLGAPDLKVALQLGWHAVLHALGTSRHMLGQSVPIVPCS